MFFPSSEIKELLFWVCAEQVVGASAAAAGGCTSHLKWQNESSCKPLRGLLAQSTNRSPWEVNTLIGLKCSMFPIWWSQTFHTLLCSVVFKKKKKNTGYVQRQKERRKAKLPISNINIQIATILIIGKIVMVHFISPSWRSLCKERKINNSFLILTFFNWRIIALQCCVVFCHTTTWISHKSILSVLSLTSTSPSSHSSRSSQSTRLRSLCHIATSH